MTQVRIRNEGPEVLVIVDGALSIQAPWNVALDIAHELIAKAKLAEEFAKANDIIFDNALLARMGAPIGLSNNKDIIAETAKEAAWNTTLRRSNIGGLKSDGIAGAPTVRHANG